MAGGGLTNAWVPKKSKETAFLVRIFHVFLWRSSKLELHFTRKAG